MEGIILEFTELAIVDSFITLLVLMGVCAGIALRWMAVEEHRGARLTWAEWPLPGAPPVVAPRMRLAA